MMEGEYGLGDLDPHPLKSAATTFLAFLMAGIVPLFPFLLGLPNAFAVSCVITLATFGAIGALKSVWSLRAWWRSSVETMLIGGAAAAIAFIVGAMFHV